MNETLCNEASKLIGHHRLPYDPFLTRAIVWAGKNVGDFELGYDDFFGKWYAKGVYLLHKECGPNPIGDNPHDAMAHLIVNYSRWQNLMREPATEIAAEANLVPRYRPYTPQEAVEFLGREVAWRGRYYYLAGVHSDHLELSVADDGKFPRVGYEQAIEQLKWRDTGEPCGVKEG